MRCLGLGEGKHRLVKSDMSRYNDPIRREIKTPVTLVLGGIAQEDTEGGARSDFVGCGGRHIGVACTTKNLLISPRSLTKHYREQRIYQCASTVCTMLAETVPWKPRAAIQVPLACRHMVTHGWAPPAQAKPCISPFKNY